MLHQQTQVLVIFCPKQIYLVLFFYFISLMLLYLNSLPAGVFLFQVSMLCLCGFPPTCLRTCSFDKLSLRSNVFLAVIQQPLQGVRSEVQ